MKRERYMAYWIGPAVMLTGALCLAQSAGTEGDAPRESRVWIPPTYDDGTYDDISAYNIFQSNRAALVAELEREPEVPEDPRPIEPVIEVPPPDPDASLILVGISVRGDQPTAFIEDRQSGKTIELTGLGEFGQGEVTAITYSKVIYVIDDETREVQVGYTFTGERPQASSESRPASSARPEAGPPTRNSNDTPAGSDADGSNTPDDGLSDLERRMRERRRSE